MAYIDQVRVKIGENDPTLYDVHARADGTDGNITKLSQDGEVVDSGTSISDVNENILTSAAFTALFEQLDIVAQQDPKIKTLMDDIVSRLINGVVYYSDPD